VAKSAVNPATTTTSGWASQLAGSAVADFLGSLAPISAAATAFRSAMKVDLTGVATVTIRHGQRDMALQYVRECRDEDSQRIAERQARIDAGDLVQRSAPAPEVRTSRRRETLCLDRSPSRWWLRGMKRLGTSTSTAASRRSWTASKGSSLRRSARLSRGRGI
jgi:hypothetical protein